MSRIRVKICCISSIEEALMAIGAGADALGLVGAMPSGPGVLDDFTIAEIAKQIPPPTASFLLTSEQSSDNIIQHVMRVGTNTVQIVDELTLGSYRQIKDELPWIKIVQVIHVAAEESIEESIRISGFVDALLLDSGKPKSDIKILGGTGQVHNWEVSREIVRRVSIPVFLAGGLNPGNVKQAIKTVRPYGVDICSGIRTNGKLDNGKLKFFMQSVQAS